MPWADDALQREFPLSWKWVTERESLWDQRFYSLRRVPTTILPGLQDNVIVPQDSWEFTEDLLKTDPQFPIELLFKAGDHQFRSPSNLATFLELAALSPEKLLIITIGLLP